MNQQHVQELVLKEHYGLLTPEEREELDMLLEYYEEAREMRSEIRREVPENEARGAMRLFNLEQGYENILAARAAWLAGQRRKWFLRSAAAILVFSAGLLLFLLNRPSAPQPYAATSAPDAIVLKLAGGRSLTLGDSGHQQISLKGTVLSNHNRQLSFTGGRGKEGAGWNTLSVPAGKNYEIELIDGTRVWLNSASKIRFPFSFEEGVRRVYVEGEAYFKVAPDVNRPFIVHSGVTVVKVLGTEFNINAYLPGKIVTSLVSGKVAVHADGEQTLLEPGNEAVTRTGSPIRVRELNPELLAWREGVYYFENASVPEIAAVVQRCFNVKMVTDSRRAREQTFRGKLHRSQGLHAFMNQLSTTGNISFYWDNGTLHCR
ncbi:FecR domain-containing protein [Chitinophaga sp.]|uniref:FecR family protein n=1 Tax=Chitinophaga sp. TaxID=1869181 RepID=UPI0031D8A429